MSVMSYIKYQPSPNVIGGTTTKNQGNLSFTVGDDPQEVLLRRQALAKELNIDLSRFVFARQQHTDKIQKVTFQDAGKGAFSHEEGIPLVDGLYTFDEHLVLAFFHADCVPILLHDPISGLIGAIHSGWQGTLSEITRKALDQIKSEENVQLDNLQVYVGPCLSFENSAVNDNINNYLKDSTFDKTPYIKKDGDSYSIDTRGLTLKMLHDAGINKENIINLQEDTFDRKDLYFSFQREHQTGRHLSFIYKIRD